MNPTFLPYNLSRQPERKHVQLLVSPDARTGEYWYENLKYWLGDPASLYWFSDWETLPYDQYTPHPDLIAERLRVLAELPTRTHGIVIASAAALRQRLCPQTHLDKYGIHLAVGDHLARDAFLQRLIDAGYQRNPHHISGKGEYAARGNIIDLYPMNATDPIRLEWLDDDVDSIRTFAVADQRTLEKREHISILPRSELDLSDAGRICYRQNARLHYGEKIVNSPLYQQISEGRKASNTTCRSFTTTPRRSSTTCQNTARYSPATTCRRCWRGTPVGANSVTSAPTRCAKTAFCRRMPSG